MSNCAVSLPSTARFFSGCARLENRLEKSFQTASETVSQSRLPAQGDKRPCALKSDATRIFFVPIFGTRPHQIGEQPGGVPSSRRRTLDTIFCRATLRRSFERLPYRPEAGSVSYPISASLLPHLAGSSGAHGAPSDSTFRDTFHSVNDAPFITRVVADSTASFSVQIHKRRRRFGQTSTRMNCGFRNSAGDHGRALSWNLDTGGVPRRPPVAPQEVEGRFR